VFDDQDHDGEQDDPGTEPMLAAFVYDALGRRIEQQIDGETTRFYYDGQNVVAEYDESDAVERYYVHGTRGVAIFCGITLPGDPTTDSTGRSHVGRGGSSWLRRCPGPFSCRFV